MERIEGWKSPQKILVILAHPDDPEFFCGASIARWVELGHEVHYALFTSGDKGCDATRTDCSQIVAIREQEQRRAADSLGVKSVTFMKFEDGYLEANLTTRKAAVRMIRTIRPSILVSCDPTALFFRENYINHPDHLAAGQIVVGAVYPAAGNALYFPELITEEGLQPHSVREIWLSLTGNPTIRLDVSSQWEKKIQALHCHQSQIDDFTAFDRHMRARTVSAPNAKEKKYFEQFRRIKYG